MICPRCNTELVKCNCKRDWCGGNCMKCRECDDTTHPFHVGHVGMETFKTIANVNYGIECAPENYDAIHEELQEELLKAEKEELEKK